MTIFWERLNGTETVMFLFCSLGRTSGTATVILFCSLGRTSGSVTVIKRGSRGIISQNVVERFRNKRISQISLQQVLLFSLFF